MQTVPWGLLRGERVLDESSLEGLVHVPVVTPMSLAACRCCNVPLATGKVHAAIDL